MEKSAEAWKSLTQGHPLNFAKVVLGISTFWKIPEEIIISVFTNKKTAVQSGHSLSKDWAGGIIALQWLLTYYPSKVILTAPTSRQVINIMFEELSKQYYRLLERSPWPVPNDALTMGKLSLGPEWYALGFTTRDSGDDIGKFQGFKSQNMLVIVSEAQRVEDKIYDEIYGVMTSEHSHILEIGNPMKPSGRFWEHCTQSRYGYHVIKSSCLDSPNYLAGSEVIPGVVSKSFVEQCRKDWGEDHPYWYGRILGEFPQSATNSVIPISWIMDAVERDIPDNDEIKVSGLDVAKFGTAETVHTVLTGRKVTRLDHFHKVDINQTVGWAKILMREERIELNAIDEGGLAGIAGFLEEDRLPVMRIQFGSSIENEDFDNLAALMWWQLRQAFQDGQISIPDDPILIGQLSSRHYDVMSRGKKKIALISKKNDGTVFWDRADSLAMAWHARLQIVAGSFMAEQNNFSDYHSDIGRHAETSDSDKIRY